MGLARKRMATFRLCWKVTGRIGHGTRTVLFVVEAGSFLMMSLWYLSDLLQSWAGHLYCTELYRRDHKRAQLTDQVWKSHEVLTNGSITPTKFAPYFLGFLRVESTQTPQFIYKKKRINQWSDQNFLSDVLKTVQHETVTDHDIWIIDCSVLLRIFNGFDI